MRVVFWKTVAELGDRRRAPRGANRRLFVRKPGRQDRAAESGFVRRFTRRGTALIGTLGCRLSGFWGVFRKLPHGCATCPASAGTGTSCAPAWLISGRARHLLR